MIGVLTIATGKYTQFLTGLYASMAQNFLVGEDITCYLFTDDIESAKTFVPPTRLKHEYFHIERMGFPGDTLYRYRHFAGLDERLNKLGLEKPDFLTRFGAS